MTFPQYSLKLFIIMKKLSVFIFMFLGFAVYAQTAQTTQIEINKVKVPGVSITIAGYEADYIQNVLQFRFEKVAGLKGSNSKGFRFYPAQVFSDFGFLKYDIYTSVDKGTKQAKFVTINLLVSKGNENFVSPRDDEEVTEKMKDFLNSFANDYLKEYEKSQRIDQLTKSVNGLEKDCTSLTSEVEKLKKDLTALENKIRDKETELTKKSGELEKNKSELETLK
jgi:polyhydroxyalkanoate synthesis regulator phasin